MKDLLIIACGAGLQDGLNPFNFMTCAVFIAYGNWLAPNFRQIAWVGIVFVFFYALDNLIFNFGPGQIFTLQKNFIFGAKITYFILSVWAFIQGIVYLKEWFLMRQDLPAQDRSDERTNLFTSKGFAVILLTIILAMVLSALATLCPINTYIMLLGNTAILKGQWQVVMMFLFNYILFGMWPLWFVWAFLSVKNIRPSLLKIICASVFFTASTCMILIFK